MAFLRYSGELCLFFSGDSSRRTFVLSNSVLLLYTFFDPELFLFTWVNSMIKRFSISRDSYWLHPLLLVIYFILNVWYDAAKLDVSEVALTFLCAGVTVGVIWVCSGLLMKRDFRNATLIATPLGFFFLNAVYVQSHIVFDVIRFRTTLAVVLGLAILIIFFLRKKGSHLPGIHTYLVVLILGWGAWLGVRLCIYPKEVISPPSVELTQKGRKDVYLLVMDAYAATPNLLKYWNHSNASFLKELRAEGFCLLDSPRTTYNMTRRVMSTMFNISYLNYDKDLSRSDEKLLPYIPENLSSRLFKASGYQTGWFSLLQETPDDYREGVYIFPLRFIYYAAARSIVSYFPMIFEKVPGYPVEESRRKYDRLMLREQQFRKFLQDSSSNLQYGYYHSELSHEKYVVNEKGFDSQVDELAEMQAYANTLTYHERHIVDLVKAIKKRNRPSIIFIMSDHGHRWIKGIPFSEAQKEGFENFMCVYETGGQYADWYRGITPVNAWRTVLNHNFGLTLPRLPDKVGIYE